MRIDSTKQESSIYQQSQGFYNSTNFECSLGISEANFIFYPEIPATILEKDSVNYIGDITFDWELSDINFSFANLLVAPLLLGDGSSFHRYGPLNIVVNNNEDTKSLFYSQFPETKKLTYHEKLMKLF